MAYWAFMTAVSLFIPTLILVIGIFFMWRAPRRINRFFGYRTSMSMKNQSTWEFAHKYCGRIWFIGGCACLPAALALMLFFIDRDEVTVSIAGTVSMSVSIIFIFVSIILTELALRRRFDKNGVSKMDTEI